jgi:sn-glycerol 3-phosphate transport system substrate-binding protein
MLKRRHGFIAIAIVASLALAACGSSSSKANPTTTTAKGGGGGGGGTTLPACPLAALTSATAPVQITVWHQFSQANATEFNKLVSDFNASQTKVKVNAVQIATYDDILAKYRAGLSGGDLPDLVQLEDANLQIAVDSQSVLPVQSCMNADHYDSSQLLPTALSYYSIKNVVWGMPFNVSTPVFFYDKSDFTRAGLDPNTPPATFAALRTDAQKLKASGIKIPFAFAIDPWFTDEWRAIANVTSVNQENGRAGRATAATIDDTTENTIFQTFADMKKDGTIQGYDRSKFDNLLAIASGDATMSVYTSAAIGTAVGVLSAGNQKDKALQLGVAALPKVNANDAGGPPVAGAAFYIVNKSAAAKQAAAWEFEKYLMTATAQAEWSVASGYIPVNKQSVDDPTVKAAWAKVPAYKVAYEAILGAPKTPATAGIVLGAYTDFRQAVEDALTKVINNGADPKAQVTAAEKAANAAITAYNQQVGG